MVHRRARAGSACRRDGLGLNRRRDRTALLRERLAVDRDPLHGLSVLKRELRRRSAIEPIIGTSEGRRSSGPLLPHRLRRRPLSRGPELPPRPRLAEISLALILTAFINVQSALNGRLFVRCNLKRTIFDECRSSRKPVAS